MKLGIISSDGVILIFNFNILFNNQFGVQKSVFLLLRLLWKNHCVLNQWRKNNSNNPTPLLPI